MFFCLFASIRWILLMHLLQLSIVFGLFGFQIKLHMLQIFKIFILYLFSKCLFFSSGLFGLSSVLFFNSLYHIVQFFQMIVVCLLHFLTLGWVLFFKNIDVPFKLLHKAVNSGILNLNKISETSKRVSMWMRWFLMAIWYWLLASSKFLSSIWMKASLESSSLWLFWEYMSI